MATFVNKLAMGRFDQKVVWRKQNTQEWLYFLSINIFAAKTTKGLCIYSPQAVEQKKGKRKNWSIWPIWPIDDPFCP